VSYKEFEHGFTGQQIAHLQAQQEESRLRELFSNDEAVFQILRPAMSTQLARNELFQLWRERGNHRTKNESSDWWSSTFPDSVRIYGPVLAGKTPNVDMLASCIGESPAGVIYSVSAGGFFFRDYLCNAYRPVSESRLAALVRRILLDAASKHYRPLSDVFLEIRALAEVVVARAKVLLEVDGDFFKGDKGRRRYSAGQYIESVETPLCRVFMEEQVAPSPSAVLVLSDAYVRYYQFCKERSATAHNKSAFRQKLNQETQSCYGVGVRNDLRSSNGKMCQGWKGLHLVDHPGKN